MPVYHIETTDTSPLFWYKQSCLVLHKNKFFAVNRDNYLGELILYTLSTEKIPAIISYPAVPFSPPRYLMRLRSSENGEHTTPNTSTQSPILRHSNTITGFPNQASRVACLSIGFFPIRYLPGEPGHIPHIAGRSIDYLTPSMKIIQNWMRYTSRARIWKKNLALAMGLHSRLGCNSPLLELGSDLIWSIVIKWFCFLDLIPSPRINRTWN